ncbi:hypothetical protein SAMN05880501_107205 [Ureibacillus xyleni]|uniref:Helix-turn-helix protein n=1 Tax=Ureibacillus xyleni TaxID=614648 RepID=A0A285SXT0_9BACL|nr:helix-turn-helix domain-containing protein [Ureibacillus xyleni]SOC13509.1 hypothetical protein SAMN05880501_107205 [Ureibacillus xyleni]
MEQLIINPTTIEKDLKHFIISTVQQISNEYQPKEWMSLKEGAKYANVSYNTFIKFREMGLKVCEIDGIKRVSKSEIDSFLNLHSF